MVHWFEKYFNKLKNPNPFLKQDPDFLITPIPIKKITYL